MTPLVSTDSGAQRPAWTAGPLRSCKLLSQVDFIEGAVEASAFGRAAHDAGVHAGLQRQIAEARRSEILAIERIENLPPEIRLGFCGYDKGFAGLFRGGRLVNPFHFGEKRFSGNLHNRGSRT